MSAAAAEGEKMWQMPLDEDYKDYLKSAFADLPNIGGRWGGAITAATFLKEFADTTLGASGYRRHAWLDDAKPFLAKDRPAWECGRSCASLPAGSRRSNSQHAEPVRAMELPSNLQVSLPAPPHEIDPPGSPSTHLRFPAPRCRNSAAESRRATKCWRCAATGSF